MKVQLSHRLDEGLAAWATEYGASRGTSRAVVIEEALRHFRELSRGGVPELPVVDTPEVRQERASAVGVAGAAAIARSEAKANMAARINRLNADKERASRSRR
jgi:hypothetical protein